MNMFRLTTPLVIIILLTTTIDGQVLRLQQREREDDQLLQQQVQVPIKRINVEHLKALKNNQPISPVRPEIVTDKKEPEKYIGRGDQGSQSGESGQSSIIPTRIENKAEKWPYISSSSSHDCSQVCVSERYLKHYASKECKPIMSNVCNCPVRYECPQDVRRPVNSTVCWYAGRSYRIGLTIPVKNVCRYCMCRDTNYGRRPARAEVDCSTSIECPEMLGARPPAGCYSVYEKDKCCSVREECPNRSIDSKQELKTCNYKGKQYFYGQKIYPDEDDCKTCICGEDWNESNRIGRNPLESQACESLECDFELEKELENGCIPIYHESTCCPIEYKCPQTNAIRLDPYPGDQSTLKSSCLFEGRQYPIGAKLKHENVCVDCTCRVPPDFTCVHKTCPTPEGENCRVRQWNDSVCCQQYDCSKEKVLERFTGPRYRSSYSGGN